ncbi:MAG: DUF4388 domain-containing protein [Deltaproteobacteria bacterium]|nr:DUF4388 domain-containing protein [Deltaproteobacteria bacterium]
MATILILYHDESTREGLATEVQLLGHEVVQVGTPMGAIEVLEDQSIEVMIAEKGFQLRGVDVMTVAEEVSPRTRTILTSEDATATDYKSAVERGAADVLNMPLADGELEASIRRALERSDGFHGNLHGLDLTDILQIFHQARRTLVVRLVGEGEIHMLDGEVIHACAPPLEGRAALKHLLTRRRGAVDTRSGEICSRTVGEAFQPLLLELMAELDEERAGRRGPPSEFVLESNDEGIVELEAEDLITADESPHRRAKSRAEEGFDDITGPPPSGVSLPLPLWSTQVGEHPQPVVTPIGVTPVGVTPVGVTPVATAAVQTRKGLGARSPLLWGLVTGVLTMVGVLAYVSLDWRQPLKVTPLPPKLMQPLVDRLTPLPVKAVSPQRQVAVAKAQEAAREQSKEDRQHASSRSSRHSSSRRLSSRRLSTRRSARRKAHTKQAVLSQVEVKKTPVVAPVVAPAVGLPPTITPTMATVALVPAVALAPAVAPTPTGVAKEARKRASRAVSPREQRRPAIGLLE